MTAMLLALVLAGSSGSADSGFVYSAMYEMPAAVAKEVEVSSGHWIPPDERQFPFARVGNGDIAVRATWTGYRGRFTARVVVDSNARIKEVRWIEASGRISRSRRRPLPELTDPAFIRQYLEVTLEELVAKRSELEPPRIMGSPDPRAYRNITSAIMIEALVTAREIRSAQ